MTRPAQTDKTELSYPKILPSFQGMHHCKYQEHKPHFPMNTANRSVFQCIQRYMPVFIHIPPERSQVTHEYIKRQCADGFDFRRHKQVFISQSDYSHSIVAGGFELIS